MIAPRLEHQQVVLALHRSFYVRLIIHGSHPFRDSLGAQRARLDSERFTLVQRFGLPRGAEIFLCSVCHALPDVAQNRHSRTATSDSTVSLFCSVALCTVANIQKSASMTGWCRAADQRGSPRGRMPRLVGLVRQDASSISFSGYPFQSATTTSSSFH